MNKATTAMLRRFPAVRPAWEAMGKPEVRPRIANDEYEASVTLTPEISDVCRQGGLLTARNPFLDKKQKQFNTRNVNILCGQIVRGEWIDGHKEVCVDRVDGKIITANHTVIAVKSAGKPIVVTARFGCDHRVEAKDGLGAQNWSTGARIREPAIYAATAFTHYRLHYGISHPTDNLLELWVDSNRSHLERVVSHLPKTPAGTVQSGYRQAGFVLALVEASLLEAAKNPDYPGELTSFLETLSDPIEGKNAWARLVREIVVKRTMGTPSKNKVYGITLSVLKPLMRGDKYSKAKGARISANTRWDDVFNYHAQVKETPAKLNESGLKLADKIASHYRVKRRDATILAAASALQVRFGTATDFESQGTTVTSIAKSKLDKVYAASKLITRTIEPISPAAAMLFALDNHTHEKWPLFATKNVLSVANEDWHTICFGVARSALGPDTRRVFDHQWLTNWFGHYVGKEEQNGGLHNLDSHALRNGLIKEN